MVLHENIPVICVSFSVLHFIILPVISGLKSVKFALKFCIFLKYLTLEGTLAVAICTSPYKYQ